MGFRILLAAMLLAASMLSGCSMFIRSGQSALRKTIDNGTLIVPAGSADSQCTPRALPGNGGTDWFISADDRNKIGKGITAGAFTDPAVRALNPNAPPSAAAQKAAESAVSALDILTSPTHQKLVALMSLATSASTAPIDKTVRGVLTGPGSDATASGNALTVDREEWKSYVNRVTAVSMTDGWSALDTYATRELKQPDRGLNGTPIHELTVLQRESRLISAYLAAYFRQGHFIAVTINPAQLNTELTTKVGSWLQTTGGTATTPSSNNLVTALSNELLPSQCKPSNGGAAPSSCDLIGSVGASGFVTRSGDKYVFPALNFQVDPLAQEKIQKPQVNVKDTIADLVRVVLEATGDAVYQLPAAQGSTACTSGLLDCYDPKTATVSTDNFQKVNEYAAEAETVASGAIGLIVRGGFWVALNNENLATAVETGVGVTARKTAERVAWDYLACKGPDPGRDFRAVAVDAGGYRTLDVRLQ